MARIQVGSTTVVSVLRQPAVQALHGQFLSPSCAMSHKEDKEEDKLNASTLDHLRVLFRVEPVSMPRAKGGIVGDLGTAAHSVRASHHLHPHLLSLLSLGD